MIPLGRFARLLHAGTRPGIALYTNLYRNRVARQTFARGRNRHALDGIAQRALNRDCLW